jgi:hypothetical protein
MVAEIEADMAAQLANLWEMQRRGELVFPTEQNAPTRSTESVTREIAAW